MPRKVESSQAGYPQLATVLSEFARTMVTDFPIQAILDHLVGRIVEILPVDAAGVTLISPGMDPRYVAASNSDALRFEQLQTELGEGPCLMAYQSGQAVTVPDLRTNDQFPTFLPRALEAGLRAVFTFPLRHGDHQLGALDLYRNTPGGLDHGGMEAAQTLADVAAAYLLNAEARADLEDSSDRSRQASLHDALTGLPNRVLMLERLEHAFLRRRRSGKTPVVLFVDLDRFKAINDTYGHKVGDEVLIAVGQRLGSQLRPGDTLARLSGDEFVILCEDLATATQAENIGRRLARALAEPLLLSDQSLTISASVGIAAAEPGEDSPEALLHDADMAMYQAKRQGGDRHQVLDLRQQYLADHQYLLARDLSTALSSKQLYTEYQPIVATADGRITGAEALLRWMHPSRGLVSPTVLIPLAEQSGLIREIGKWVLERAWSDRHRWQSQRPGSDLAMSVNVSAHQLMSPGFVSSVGAVLAAADTDPRLLTLEVTESVFVQDSERALLVLHDLKNLGVKLALDDFGTGYSSLSYLRQFPVDIVKIDRTFVSELCRDPISHMIVAAVVGLAHNLGITVVAEGVETAEQYREVTGLGCDFCQGFYFAKPMLPDNFYHLIQPASDGGDRRLPVLTEPRSA